MAPRNLWVLKAHMKIDKIDDKLQNIGRCVDLYPNIDNQKTKK